MTTLKALSLFSGIGGLDLAAEAAGIETVAFCEIEPFCRKVLAKHWPGVPIHKDVFKLRGERVGAVDIIHGGFPCQPFSVAGRQGGKDDERYLWPEFSRLVEEIRPRWVVAENVPGIMRIAADDVCADLERLGYSVGIWNYEALSVRAAHRRARVFFVGYSERCGCDRFARGGAGQESAYGCSPYLGHAKGMRCDHRDDRPRQRSDSGKQRAPRDAGLLRGDIADPQSIGRGEGAEDIGRRAEGNDSGAWGGSSLSRAGIPDAALLLRGALERFEQSGVLREIQGSADTEYGGREGRDAQGRGAATTLSRCGRRPESRLGVRIDGLSAWLAGDWERGIPRTARGVKDRVNKLRSLGNAVDPRQGYLIFLAIAEVEAYYRHGYTK